MSRVQSHTTAEAREDFKPEGRTPFRTDSDNRSEDDKISTLATTIPRKRIVLDFNPSTGNVTAKCIIVNKSGTRMGFTGHSSFDEGYTIEPKSGFLEPGESVHVTLHLKESLSFNREVDQDKFTVDVSNDDAQEKHILFTAISQPGKDRLVFLAAKQEEDRLKEVDKKRIRRIYTYFGTAACMVMFAIIGFVDFCELTGEKPPLPK